MNYTKQELDLIILDSFEELTYKNKYDLLCGLTQSLPTFKNCEEKLIKSLSHGVYNKIRDLFNSNDYKERILKEYKERGIECVTFFSQDYPEKLRHISVPPIVLYCKGNRSLLQKRLFSVVGSRRTAPNAIAACKKICSDLCSHFAVVTGIADGADTAALEGALEGNGAICVLAHGFNFVYPAGNKQLLDKVINKGLAITEHLPQIAPRSYLFSVRNRIIAGISEGTLIVSAGKKSGALITASYAYEYGRELFAFPYNIGVASGEGCNALIKKGAYLTENILDIGNAFGLDLKPRENLKLTKQERELLAEIKSLGEAHIMQLANAFGVQSYELAPLLSSLEVKKLIVRLGGNRYASL